jgi:hypothetical protein
MKNIIFLLMFALNGVSFAENQAKPHLWHEIRDCDLCIIASSVKIDKGNVETLVDSKKKVIAKFYPAKMQIDRILHISRKMKFDGRFLTKKNQEYLVNPKHVNQIDIYLLKKLSGAASVVDAHFIGDNPNLPADGIFTLIKSDHKKSGEFIITSVSGVEKEREYVKALQDTMQEVNDTK